MGVTAEQAARSLAEATSSSRFTAANFWADPKSGVGYQVQVQVPIQRMDSLEQVRDVPVGSHDGQQIQLRQTWPRSPNGTVLGEYDRYNMQRMLTLGAQRGRRGPGPGGRPDRPGDPRGRRAAAQGEAWPSRGQIAPMRELFGGLGLGLGVAVLVIFLLLAANFQSFRLSLAVVLTVPAVVAGVAVALRVTRTTLNIQSFMGAIMAVGVAVANSILLITFAERSRVAGSAVPRAAVEGASEPAAADPDDQPGDDRRHGPHGHRTGRGRRADRAAGPGRDRRA